MPFVILMGFLWVAVCALSFYGRRKESWIRADEWNKLFEFQAKLAERHNVNGGAPHVGKDGHDYYLESRHFPANCAACEAAHREYSQTPLYRN